MAKRNYKKEYANYHSKPAQRKRRSERTVARRKSNSSGRTKKGDGKDLHHPNATKKKLGKKTVVQSKSINRSNNRHKKGESQNRKKK